MKHKTNVAIIGGGPSGLTAAITIKRMNPKLSVLLLEKKDQLGKKLRTTGNGRCNLSNVGCEFPEMVIGFLMSVGIAVRKDESGRLYPYSEDAGEVTEVLTTTALGEGVKILVNTTVNKVEADREGGFLLFVEDKHDAQTIGADKVLLATGGKSYASLGTTGDGYLMARKLGHRVTPLAPALTAVETKENLDYLKGVRCKGVVSLFDDGELIFKESGEIQFRKDGISGICVMNMSLQIKPKLLKDSNTAIVQQGERTLQESISLDKASEQEKNTATAKLSWDKAYDSYIIGINLVPDFGAMEILNLLRSRSLIKGYRVEDILKTLVKEPLAQEILRRVKIESQIPAISLEDEEILRIANQLRSFRLHVKGLKGWNEAQVTAGGVPEAEVDSETMESKLVPGLYLSGEVMEYAGPCGGYNLHHAWLTGIKAGEAIAYALKSSLADRK